MHLNLHTQNNIEFKNKIKQFFLNEIETLKQAKKCREQMLQEASREDDIYRLKTASPSHILRIKELHDLGLAFDVAHSYAYNDGIIFKDIKKIASEGNYQRYVILQKMQVPRDEHQKYYELTQQEFDNVIRLLSNKVDYRDAIGHAKKYNEANIQTICDLCRTEQIHSVNVSYFVDMQKSNSSFSTKNILELSEQKIFSERMISEILLSGKKDEILNSQTLKDTRDVLNRVKERRDKFFAIFPRQIEYIKGETPRDSYDFLVNYLFQINDAKMDEYSFDKKSILYFELLSVMNSGIFTSDELEKIKLPQILEYINNSMTSLINIADVDDEDCLEFFNNFVANNKPWIEDTIANFDYLKYEKEGLPLLYSREKYINDLNNILTSLNNEEKSEVYKKLEITPFQDEKKNGYDGIINIRNLDLNNDIEKEVFEISKRFIYENEVVTEDINFNKIANSIIKGMPEFINIIGKKQHRAQTLDIHSFLVLKNVITNPEYKKLSGKNKTILKFCALLHDISKQEFTVDSKHPVKSSIYAKNILERFNLPFEMKKDIVNIILNHHWLADYAHKSLTPNRIAFNLREGDNFSLSKILTRADLMGVDEKFYCDHKSQLHSSKINPILDKIQHINSNGQLIFSNKIINKNKIPKIQYKNREYKVIDFSKYSSEFDLFDIGFEPNVNKKNLRLLVHMADFPHELETVMRLGKLDTDRVLCASYISLKNKPTYYNIKFGLSLDSTFGDVVNSSKHNQASGRRKGRAQLDNIIENDIHRENLSGNIAKAARITKREYANLYYQLQSYRICLKLLMRKYMMLMVPK